MLLEWRRRKSGYTLNSIATLLPVPRAVVPSSMLLITPVGTSDQVESVLLTLRMVL